MMAHGARRRQCVAPVLWAGAALGAAHVPAAVTLVPALAVLRGPVGIALAALAVAQAALRCTGPFVYNFEGRVSADRVAFTAAFVLYVAAGLWYTTRLRVTGDEPHYLLMAQSLWREGDLDLQDNYARQDWREYTPGPIVPHYGAPRADGRPFPAHSPGLPLLLAPFYALGGRIACVLLLAAIAAAVAALTRVLAVRAGATTGASWFAWFAVLGAPLLFYAFHVYTEAASALALFGGLCLLGAAGGVAAAAAGLALGTLPWLHVKMIAAAAAAGDVAVVRLHGRARAAFVAAAGLAAAAYATYLFAVFGRPTPLAIYHGSPAQMSGSPLSALAGLVLDRSFGLLPHAPVFLLALAGLVPLVRRWRETWPMLLIAFSVLSPVLPWRMWWGGQSPPGRFLVPLVPVLAVAVALRLSEASRRGLARWRWPLAAIGLTLGLYATARPGDLLLVNRGDRPTRLWATLSGHGSIERYLPSIVNGGAEEWQVAAVWLVVVAGLVTLDRLALRHDGADRAFRSLGLPLVVLLAGSMVVDRFIRAPEKGPYAASVLAEGTSRRHQEATTPAARIPSTTTSR